MANRTAPFGIRVVEVFQTGFAGYTANIVPLTLAAAATLVTYMGFRLPAAALARDATVVGSIVLDVAGLLVASVVAHPWFAYALAAGDGTAVDVRQPFRHTRGFAAHAVGSIWFWAGALLGLRYLYGIPSIFVVVFYAFYGYVVADGTTNGGLKALGASVRLGEGRRIGLFALAALFAVFNLFGAIALGFGVNVLTGALAFVGVIVTSNITMVGGARTYRTLQRQAAS